MEIRFYQLCENADRRLRRSAQRCSGLPPGQSGLAGSGQKGQN